MTTLTKEILCNGCGYGSGDCFCDIDWNQVEVKTKPQCKFCGSLAQYDTIINDKQIWAYVCEEHFITRTPQKLGLGKGQKLVYSNEVK